MTRFRARTVSTRFYPGKRPARSMVYHYGFACAAPWSFSSHLEQVPPLLLSAATATFLVTSCASVCVRARVHVCTCGLPAYFVILIARGRPPPLLQPNSAPSLPTPYCTAPLHPMLTPPFLCASSSCSTRRHPSENLRLSDNLQSHVFSCVSAPTMIYELSQICIRVT